MKTRLPNDASILVTDLAKTGFQVCATASNGEILFNRKFSRPNLERFLDEHSPSLVALRRRLVAFHHGLATFRFGFGEFRFALGEFLHERGTRRTLSGTIVRARSDEFGSPAAGCAGCGGTRIHDSRIYGLKSISKRNIDSRTKYFQIVALMPHIWIDLGTNSTDLLGR